MKARRNYGEDSEGARRKGVTEYIKIIDKPGLVFWGYKKGVEAMFDEVLRLFEGKPQTQVHVDDLVPCADNARARRIHEKQRDDAASAGTYAHALIDAMLSNRKLEADEIPSDPEAVKKGEIAFQKWRKWYISTGFEVLHSEVAIISKAHDFGATIDGAGIRSGKKAGADWKTSGSGLFPEVFLQMGGYAIAWEEENGEAWEEVLVVNVPVNEKPIDEMVMDKHDLELGKEAFLAAHKLSKLWAQINKRWKEKQKEKATA